MLRATEAGVMPKRIFFFMPEPDPAKIMTFASPKDLGRWLKVNHAIERELWVKIFKKKSEIPSVTWNDVVIEILC